MRTEPRRQRTSLTARRNAARRMGSRRRKTLEGSRHQAGSKQIRLRLVYVDFWSAMKLALIAGIALAALTMISALGVFAAVSAAGYVSDLDEFVYELTGGSTRLSQFVNLPQVLALSSIAATLNLVIVTVLGAVIAGIYNRAADVANGLPVGFTSHPLRD